MLGFWSILEENVGEQGDGTIYLMYKSDEKELNISYHKQGYLTSIQYGFDSDKHYDLLRKEMNMANYEFFEEGNYYDIGLKSENIFYNGHLYIKVSVCNKNEIGDSNKYLVCIL